MHENNLRSNCGTVTISDRELGHRTRLSKQTITEAKRALKNRGLIDFHTDRDKPKKSTTYTLPFFTQGQQTGHEVGQKQGHEVGHECFVPYTAHTEDLRQKTFPSVNQSRAHEIFSEWDDFEEVIAHWYEKRGAGLDFAEQSQFKAWLDRHGKEWMLNLIDRAKEKCQSRGMSMKYICGFMRTEENKKAKGARKNEPTDYNALLGY